MQKEITYNEALSKLAALCSRSEQCILSCTEKLTKWGISESDSKKIIQYLISEKYIDERRYALFFAKDKHSLSHWGKLKIGNHLKLKKIPSEYIKEALESISEEKYKDQLYELLKNKLKSVKARNSYELKGKLFRFALGRGFESNKILQNINQLFSENNINSSDEYETFND